MQKIIENKLHKSFLTVVHTSENLNNISAVQINVLKTNGKRWWIQDAITKQNEAVQAHAVRMLGYQKGWQRWYKL